MRILPAIVLGVMAGASARSQPVSDPQIRDGWQSYLANVDQPPFPIAASTVDPRTGDTWIATWGGGLVRFSGGRFEVFNQFNSGLAADLVFDVAVAGGRVFAATIGGISAFEPTVPTWSLYFARRSTDSRDVWIDLAIRDGALRATSSHGEVRRYDAENDRWMDAGSADPPRRPEGLLATTDSPKSVAAPRALAIYGPRSRTIQLPGPPSRQARDPARCDLTAVETAVSSFNKERNTGGNRIGLLKVSPGYSRYGWTLPEDDVAFFALDRQVGGVVGHLSPRAQPILNEVIAWTGIAFVSTACLDDTDQEALFANPFAFRCYGAEKQRHRALLDHLFSSEGTGRIAIVRSGSAFDDLRIGWWSDYALRRGVEVVGNESWRDEGTFPSAFARQRPDVVVTWRDAESTVRLVQQLRAVGLDCPIVVSPACLRDDIGSLVESPLGSLVTIDDSLDECTPLVPSGEAESRRADTVWRVGPKTEKRDALGSFAGADHLLHAIARANGNRSIVVRMLKEMRDSAYGEKHFEQRHSPPLVSVVRFEGGRWVRFTIRAK